MPKSIKNVCLLLLVLANQLHAAKPSTFPYGMVVSEQRLASEVGAAILQAGGNAIDAAVAVGYALAVTYPCCGNIGGGGFMTIHLADGRDIFVNFRERAPLRASEKMFINRAGDASMQGYLAVATPGTVLGLETVLKKYGTMSRAAVITPAIKLAHEGFILAPSDTVWFQDDGSLLKQQTNVAAIFFKNGHPYQAGERLVQKDLAHSLELIAQSGTAAFYKGPIANTVVQVSKQHGGILTHADFTTYHIKETKPLYCSYRGYTIVSAPLPSSGGITLCEMLNILENFPLRSYGYQSARSMHIMLSAMRYAYTDRNLVLGDPDFVSNHTATLIAKPYAKSLSNHIDFFHHLEPSTPSHSQHELTDTTHYSILDTKGNAVATTYTINGFFGARIIAANTGFFLNNEMDDFTTILGQENKFGLVQSMPNNIQPGKRPLSSMAPTIVMKEGKVWLVLGTPGGARIITTLLQTLVNIIDYDMSIQDAINAPRIHYQAIPNTVYTEPFAIPFATAIQLRNKGYHLTPQHTWGSVVALYVDQKDGKIHGATDNRRPGAAASQS